MTSLYHTMAATCTVQQDHIHPGVPGRDVDVLSFDSWSTPCNPAAGGGGGHKLDASPPLAYTGACQLHRIIRFGILVIPYLQRLSTTLTCMSMQLQHCASKYLFDIGDKLTHLA